MHCPTLAELPPGPAGKSGWPWTEQSLPLADQGLARAIADAPWPKFTIVTPAYNAGHFIEETIRSVLLQGYPNLEYIIVDGGSRDGSVDVIRQYAPWLTYWCSEPDRGQSHALNKGFSHGTGEWLAWLNADDLYASNALYQVALTARQHPATHWIVGVLRWMDENGVDVGATAPTPFAEVNNAEQWRGVLWLAQVCLRGSALFRPQPASFWSRAAQATVGPLDETLHYAMDLDLWGKLAYSHFSPMLIPEELAYFRLHATQKSATGELRFMVDELAIVDQWLPKLNGQNYQTMVTYRAWLYQELKWQQKHLHWQKLMRNQQYHAIFTLAKNLLNSTKTSKRLLERLNKRRPSWMLFYG